MQAGGAYKDSQKKLRPQNTGEAFHSIIALAGSKPQSALGFGHTPKRILYCFCLRLFIMFPKCPRIKSRAYRAPEQKQKER